MQKGLRGCGAQVAYALANNGFGETLCDAARKLSTAKLSEYLFGWREEVRAFLQTDPLQSMGTRHPALASSMPDSFPNLEVLSLYLFPLTSSDKAISGLNLDGDTPNITQITQLCELYFSWGNPSAILVKFENGVFQVLLMVALRDEIVRREEAQKNEILESHEVCPYCTAIRSCLNLATSSFHRALLLHALGFLPQVLILARGLGSKVFRIARLQDQRNIFNQWFCHLCVVCEKRISAPRERHASSQRLHRCLSQ